MSNNILSEKECVDLIKELNAVVSVQMAGKYFTTLNDKDKGEFFINRIIQTLRDEPLRITEATESYGTGHARSVIDAIVCANTYYVIQRQENAEAISDSDILAACVGYTQERRPKSITLENMETTMLNTLMNFTQSYNTMHNLKGVKIIPYADDRAYCLASDGFILGGVSLKTTRPDIMSREEHGSWRVKKSEHNSYKILDKGEETWIACDEDASADFTQQLLNVIPPGKHHEYFGNTLNADWAEDEFFTQDEIDIKKLINYCHYIKKFASSVKRFAILADTSDSIMNNPTVSDILGMIDDGTPFTSYVDEWEYRPIICFSNGASRGVFNAELVDDCIDLLYRAGVRKVKMQCDTGKSYYEMPWRRPLLFLPASSEVMGNLRPEYVLSMVMPIQAERTAQYADCLTTI